jgi:hypothetical protein
MIKTENGVTTIQCDKCQSEQSAPEGIYNSVFGLSGWVLKTNARKYIHRCAKCTTKREKKSLAFVNKMFPNV